MSYAIRKDGLGWRAINKAEDVTADEVFSALKPAPISAPAVPQSVSALQALLALDHQGMSGAYEEWAGSPQRTFAQRAFIQKAQTWKRDDPTLLAAATDLGLTGQQIDDLFSLADTL